MNGKWRLMDIYVGLNKRIRKRNEERREHVGKFLGAWCAISSSFFILPFLLSFFLLIPFQFPIASIASKLSSIIIATSFQQEPKGEIIKGKFFNILFMFFNLLFILEGLLLSFPSFYS